MVDTEPIHVRFTADASDLQTGASQARAALQSVGNQAEDTGFHLRKVTGDTGQLFRGLIEMRVASMSAERVMKDFGISSKEASAALAGLNTVLDVAITISAALRAVKIAEGLAHWFAAKAGFAEAAAEESIATLGFGMPAATAEAATSIALLSGFIAMARGGIVTRPTMALIGERGPEAVIPLNRAGGMGGVGGVSIHIEHLETGDVREFVYQLGREIQKMKLAGA